MSTAPNLRMLFNTYHNGFSGYPAWFDHHKAMHAKHPLECAEFGAKWLGRWEAVGRLFSIPAATWHAPAFASHWIKMPESGKITVGDALAYFAEYDGKFVRCKVTLLDGTIVKEWGVT